MKNVLKTLIILFTTSTLFAQVHEVDSLRQELKEVKSENEKWEIIHLLNVSYQNHPNADKKKKHYQRTIKSSRKSNQREIEIETCILLSSVYLDEMNFDSARYYAKMGIDRSIKRRDQHIHSYNQMGRVYHHFQKYENAIMSYKKAIDLYEKSPTGSKVGYAYNNLGILEIDRGNHSRAIDYLIKGLEVGKRTKNSDVYTTNLSSIAWVYMQEEQYDRAEEYYIQALEDSTNVKYNEQDKYVVFRGLSLIYSRTEQYQKALDYALPTLAFFEEKNDVMYTIDMLTNIATIYYRKEEYNRGLSYELRSLKLAQQKELEYPIIVTKMNVAGFYEKLGRKKEAKELLLEVVNNLKYSLGFKTAIRDVFKTTYLRLSEFAEEERNYKKSLEYFKKFQLYSDSILREQRDSEVTEIEQKYQAEKKEKELKENRNVILTQKLNVEQTSRKNTRLVFILFLSSILLLVFGYFIRRRGIQVKVERRRYNHEVAKVVNLKLELEQKTIELKEDFSLRLNRLHEKLKEKYNLSHAIFEFWLLQVEGISEEEMQKRLFISASAIKSRRGKLYNALKQKEEIESSESFSRFRSVGIYQENLLKHFI